MISDLINLLRLISKHPLSRTHRLFTWHKFIRWQIGSRLVGYPIIMPWIGQTRLIISRGMRGATGNLYFGLHEFSDMGFCLHFLRSDNLFLDIGANVGTYTLLAAGVTKAKVIAFEPNSEAYSHLLDNVRLNRLEPNVEVINIALGAENGSLLFSTELDTENHVLPSDVELINSTTEVQVTRLDDVLRNRHPIMIKMDVEGYETEVLRGGVQVFSSPFLRAVLIELNGSSSRYGFSDEAIRSRFFEWGFVECSYDPITRCLTKLQDNAHNVSLTGNTLYIRDLEIVQSRLLQSPPFQIFGQTI